MLSVDIRTMCIGLVLSSAFFVASSVSAASADETELDSALVIDTIEKANPSALEGLPVVESDGELTASFEEQTASIPISSTGKIEVEDQRNPERGLVVELPFSESGNHAEKIKENSVLIDNENGTASTVSVREDASVQVHTVISDKNSPTRFEYKISVPPGGSMTVQDDGSVVILGSTGEFIGGVAPDWAKDNLGNSVPTWYEVDGNTLVQIVDHDKATEYPVVADPWFGIKLFNGIWRDWYNNDYRYNGNVSAWGATVMWGGGNVGGYANGQFIMRTVGWNEWVAAYEDVKNKPTLRQQYNCHVLAGTIGLPFTGTYNLERFRRDNSNWGWNVLQHRCNW